MSDAFPSTPVTEQVSEKETILLDLLIVLATRKRLLLALPILVSALTASIVLLLPNVYTATATILPPQSQQSAAFAMLGQLSGLAGGGLAGLGVKNPTDLYVGMLKSRTIADKLIARFNLQELFDERTLVDTRRALAKVTDISSGREGIISISVDDVDSSRAALLANAYVDELDRLSKSIAITEASQRRLFFERQLSEQKDHLANAEIELRKTQESSGLIQLDEQAKSLIGAIATLNAQVMSREAEIASMRVFATPQNPEFIRLQRQLKGLRDELSALQSKHTANRPGDVIVPTANLPEMGLEYLRRLRDVKYHEALFEMLAKQYELAKIDESRDAAIIQIVDTAVAPDKKSHPKRLLLTLLSFLASLFAALVLALALESVDRARRNPLTARRLKILRQRLRFRLRE